MNTIRRVLFLAAALMLTAFALPSFSAPQLLKLYSLTTTSDPAVPLIVNAGLMNISPNGNSNISSFSLTVSGGTILSVDPLPGGGTVTVDPTTHATVFVNNIPQIKPNQTLQLTLHMGGCGDALTWTAMVWTGNNQTGQPFTPSPNPLPPAQVTTNVACNVIACDTPFVVPFQLADGTQPSSSDPRYVTGLRGKYDKDGTVNNAGCVAVPTFVSNNLIAVSGKTIHFRWPQTDGPSGDSAAAFSYVINLPTNTAPRVAWLNTNGTSAETGTPAFIDITACTSPDLPAPYGILAADVAISDTQIKVDPSAGVVTVPAVPPGPPFAIVVGSERMLVTKVTGNNVWNVVRGQGGTTPAAYTASPPTPVVSTPLPLLPSSITCYDAAGNTLVSTSCPYVPLNQAQMCLSGQGTAGGNFFFRITDIGDGWGGHP